MARLKLVLPLAAALAGCAAFEGPQPSESEHAICYTRLETSPDQLTALAKQACGGAAPHFLRQDVDLGNCPLLVPERTYFSCASR